MLHFICTHSSANITINTRQIFNSYITSSHLTMRGFLVLAIVSAAAAAPTGDTQDINFLEESQRTKKSPAYGGGIQSYGLPGLPSAAPGYGAAAPCAGGAPLAPVTFVALAPQAAPLHYRENEHRDHQQARTNEHGRAYYDSSAAAISASLAAAGSGAGAAGPAIGLFPNAKVGGCAVPLLLSCSPNVVSGHLAHQPSYAAPAASSYGASSVAAAPIAVPLAPSGYRAQETGNFEHNIRNINSGPATSMISEPKAAHFSEHASSSVQ